MFNNFTHPINIVQHNIGSIPYKFKNTLYDLSGYREEGNKVKNKWDEINYRNIDNYLSTNNDLLSNMDILFLQEVQEGSRKINKNVNNVYLLNNSKQNKLSINYNPTGKLFYANNEENINSIQEIHHGCALIINLGRFQIIDTINCVMSKMRTTSWFILKDKLLGNLYAIISIHGIIPSPLIKKYIIVENFFKTLVKNIEDLKRKYSNISIIIAGDFNINLEKPNFDPYYNVKKNINNK